MITKQINIIPDDSWQRIHVSQGDIGRTLQFVLYEGSTSYTIPTGATVKIQGTKPSGLGFSETCTWSGSTVTVDTTEAMTQEFGGIPTELQITDGTDVLGTTNFLLIVERNPHPDNTTDGTQDTIASLEVRIEALESAISSGGITDDIKQALLDCFEHVAWTSANGQSYYDALEEALYPPADLVSISAVYTQSGTVYNTDSLDSLKSDLVVTATYDDSSTATVTSYTLSGTLTTGTSTITVAYGGKTTTFNVIVSAVQHNYLYNWDFTQSMTDSVASQEATASAGSGYTAPTRGNTGIVFDSATQSVYLGNIDLVGKTIEIDVASFAFAGNSSYHVRFLMTNAQVSGNYVGSGPVIYRSGNGWTSYGYKDSTHNSSGYRLWSADGWGSLYSTASGVIDSFNNKTVKVVFDSDGHTKSLYLDDVFIATMTDVYFNHDSNNVYLGGISTTTESNGDQCYNMTVSGVRIYENE